MAEAGVDLERGLSVSRLSKRFGSKQALDDLSFAAPAGEILALLGPNGAGKTTTLNCIAGLVRQDAGSVRLNRRELGSRRGREVALIPETPDVYDLLTVWEHMIFVARSCRLAAGWEPRAEALLQRLAMTPERDTLGQALSKGMKQKVLVAASVIAGTPVLLLDEPMIGLDPAGQRELRAILLELRAQGLAVVVSTHMLQSVESYCDRLLIIKKGRAVADGSLDEVLRQSGGKSLEETFLDIVE